MRTETPYPHRPPKVFHCQPENQDLFWSELRNACSRLSDWGLQELRRGLGEHVGTIALEPYYICKDHRSLYSHFYSKKFAPAERDCSRLHFFTEGGLSLESILTGRKEAQDSYMGYSVIRPAGRFCLGRTIIDPRKIGKTYNNGYCCLRTEFVSRLGGASYSVMGFPFMSQDAEATVCAHSALWSTCRYLSERYKNYGELLPFDIIRLTGLSEGRSVPYRSMTYKDYCEILSRFGSFPIYRVLQRRRADNTFEWDRESFKEVYTLVESGFPVLASLRLAEVGHVVVLVGHTYNAKKEIRRELFSDGPFIESSYFLDSFLVADDNHFPYARLGFDNSPANEYSTFARRFDIKCMVTATCPMPERVYLSPSLAKAKCLPYVKAKLGEIKALAREPYVTRLFVTTCKALKKKLMCTGAEGDAPAAFMSNIHMPHFVWVMEVIPLSNYQEDGPKKAIAGIILDPTAGRMEAGVICMRIGRKLLLPKWNCSAENMSTTTLTKEFEGAPCEFPIFTHNLGERHG